MFYQKSVSDKIRKIRRKNVCNVVLFSVIFQNHFTEKDL